MTGLVCRRAKLVRRGRIEVDPALGRELVSGRDARTHEGGDVIDALELLPGLLGHREGKPGGDDTADYGAGQRHQSWNAKGIDPPDQHQAWHRD